MKKQHRKNRESIVLYCKTLFLRYKNFLARYAKKEIILFPEARRSFSFKPFFVAQGLAVFLLVFALASFFIPQSKINQELVIKSAIIKQTSAIVAEGQPVKWTALVKRSDINNGKHLIQLPKSAKNIKITTISANQAKLVLSQKPVKELTLTQRQQLAKITPVKPAGFFAKLTTFMFADLEQAASDVVENITETISSVIENQDVVQTSEATIVDLSSQAPAEQKQEEKKEEKQEQKEEKQDKKEEKKSDKSNKSEQILAENPAEDGPPLTSAGPEQILTPELEPDQSLPAENIEEGEQPTEQPAEQPAEIISQEPSASVEVAPDVDLLDTASPSDSQVIASEEPGETRPPENLNAGSAEVGPLEAEEFVQVEYETPAPQITEQETNTGKLVTVSDPSTSSGQATDPSQPPLVDVLAFTNIPEIYKVGQEDKIKIKWQNPSTSSGQAIEGEQYMAFIAMDLDDNGKLDYVEWTVPHLSDQTFEIIFISKAFQLDQNQNILADIYDQVRYQDNTWQTIENNQYVRVTFEQILDNTKDNTIYARPAAAGDVGLPAGSPTSSAFVEVYPVYTDANGNTTEGPLVATFPAIDHEGTYKVLLTNLATPTDVFDLKIIGGNVDIDYIVDPGPPSEPVNTVQSHFKIYQDDAGLNSATQYADEDTNYNIIAGINFRIRFEISSTAGITPVNVTRRLEFKEDAGAWTQITTNSNNVRLQDSTNFTDGDVTTTRLTAMGIFVVGQGKDTGSDASLITLSLGKYVEDEYSLKFQTGAVGHTYQFRITNVGVALTTYTQTPSIAPVSANTAPSLTSVADSPDPIKGGNQITITPSGQADTESDALYFYCNETGAEPTTDNTLCSPNSSYASPYSDMTCTYNVSTGDATRTVYCRTFDGTDYSAASPTASYTVDSTVPTVTDNAPAAWQKTNITTTLSCDDGAGSGCSKVYYTTDGSTPSTATSSYVDASSSWQFAFTTEATATLNYRGLDAVGNFEDTVTASNQLRLDKTAPVTTATAGSYTFGEWSTGNVTVTLACTDTSGSGCSATKYCTDTDNACSPATTYASPVVVATGGTSYIRYYSTDNADNSETSASKTIKINTAPSFSAIATSPDLVGLGSSITFSSTASDADSGDTATLYVCKLNDFTGTACGVGGEWCHSSASVSNPSCSYTILSSDTSGEKTYYGYIIDSHNLQSASNPRSDTFTTDINPPVISAVSPTTGTVSQLPSSISFTLNEIGYCRISTADLLYSEMTSANDCSGGGSTSITCSTPSVAGTLMTLRVSCADALGNESASSNNPDLVYSMEAGGVGGGGGGGWVASNPVEPVVAIAKNIIQQIAEAPQAIAEQAQNIVSNVGNVITALLPQPKEEQIAFPPIEELALKTTPDALSHKLDLVQTKDFGELDVSFLPLKFKDLVHKFPEIASTLEKVGITKADDVKKLNGVEFSFPGLSSVAGVKMPNDFIFATAADNKIDINMKVALTDKQEVAQSFNIISNRQINLVIKPQSPAKSVEGMVVLIPQLAPISKNNLQKASASLLGSVVLAAELQSENKEIVLDKFAYTDNNNDGIYEADIQAPGREGKYEIRTTINYKNEEIPSKQISIVAVVDPEGYIYQEVAGLQARIKNAEVSIYWLNPETKQYEIWPAKDFQQENPQKTNETGKYSFLVPPGYYYLAVQADGYLPYKGKPFQVSQGAEVNTNIQLIPKNWLVGIFSVERILMAVIIALLILVIIILYFIKVKKIKTS